MTEVALDTATPHAPSVIRLLLDKVGVAYREVVEHPHLPAASRVQAVLLDDEVGALMVLFPQSQLLDLNRLTELTGRKLTAVPVQRLKQMLDKHQLKALPGIPALTSLAVPVRKEPARRRDRVHPVWRSRSAAGD
ncbi:hypothetical protein GLGCALEP_06444 [Pseudomonas sp. MM221]|nr:hypothetical protein DBADOPDK_06290 [Pseudomonas sp. MM223]CAI3811180.1 hypothetical protein GLGCALEP_06444 [Pseudomonas sp. MM221]